MTLHEIEKSRERSGKMIQNHMPSRSKITFCSGLYNMILKLNLYSEMIIYSDTSKFKNEKKVVYREESPATPVPSCHVLPRDN
jgi:hypothetical protein